MGRHGPGFIPDQLADWASTALWACRHILAQLMQPAPPPLDFPYFFFLSVKIIFFYFINQCDVWSGIPAGGGRYTMVYALWDVGAAHIDPRDQDVSYL